MLCMCNLLLEIFVMISCVTNCNMIKTKPRFIFKQSFNEQSFSHEIYQRDLNRVSCTDDVELVWNYLKNTFLSIIDKHAPL